MIVHVPDVVTRFCVTAIRNKGELIKGIVEATWRNKIYNEDVSMDFDQLLIPFDSLKKYIHPIAALKDEVEEAITFFNQAQTSDLTKVKGKPFIFYDVREIQSISPPAICERFVKRVQRDVSNILTGSLEINQAIEIYSDPVERENIQGQFFKSTIPDYITLKHLGKLKKVTTYYVTQDTIADIIIPFLLEITDVRFGAKSTQMGYGFKKSSFKDIVLTVERSFSKLLDKLKAMHSSMLHALELSGKSKRPADTLFATIYTLVYDAESRLMALLLRFFTAYMQNIREVFNLKSVMSWKDGISSKVFTEAYNEEDYGNHLNLSMTNSMGMLDAIDELRTCIRNCTNITDDEIRENGEKFTTINPYYRNRLGRDHIVDDIMYQHTVNEFARVRLIVQRLFDGITYNGDGEREDINFSDALEEHGLYINPDAIFSEILRDGYDVSPYYAGASSPSVILTELTLCRAAIIGIAEEIKNFGGFLSDMIASLDSNPNGMYLVDTYMAKDWVRKMVDALGKFNVDLAQDYRKRITLLAKEIDAPNRFVPHTVVLDKDYLKEPTDEPECLSYYEEEAVKEELLNLNRHYGDIFRKKISGLSVFYEEYKGPDDKSQGDNPKPNESGEKKSEEKPVVHDGGANKNQGDGAGEKGKDTSSSNGKVTDKLKTAINTILEAVSKIFAGKGKSVNMKFLSANRQFLLNRNYVNTSVEILPYRKETNYFDMVQGCIDKARGINDNTLKSVNEEGLRNLLFSNIKIPKTDEGLDSDLLRGFKVGTAEFKAVTIADNELKALVPQMIKYCESYYNSTEASLKNLQSSISKLSIFDQKDLSDEQVKNNVNLIGTMLVSAVKAARNASKDRCNKYLEVLSALAASNKDKEGSASQESSQQNEKGETTEAKK